MAQRASLRDQTPLSVEKRRSNRTVYILRGGSRAAWKRSGAGFCDSERRGPGLPGPGCQTAAGEPARP